MIRLLLIDDDPLVCTSLQIILQAEPDIQVVASGNSGEQALALCRTYQPDILLMDIQMQELSGLDAGAQLLQEFPALNLLFLTTFSDDDYIARALRIGAKGYLIKQNAEAIAPALRAVISGQSVFGNEVTAKLPSLLQASPSFSWEAYAINSREQTLIRLVAQGLNNKEIADVLFLSEGTVRNYLSIILDKLQLRDRTQLAIFYYQQGQK